MMEFVLYLLLFVLGAFAITDEMKTVSVIDGDSVTLSSNAAEIQKGDLITWTFGTDRTRIAQINRLINKVSLYDDVLNGKFRGRLKLDDQTGSLTITDMRSEDAGLYELLIAGGKELPEKMFNIIVFARLPVPVIVRNSPQCSSCSVVCSVVNVHHVTLSWLKGNSVLSSITASDLSISLSLPLEVEDQKNTYSCEIRNTVTHQNTLLNISELCQRCEALGLSETHIAVVCVCALILPLILCGIYCYCKKKKAEKSTTQNQAVNTDPMEMAPLTGYGEDEIRTIQVNAGNSVTLETGIDRIEEDEFIEWSFSTRGRNSFSVIANWNKRHREGYRDNRDIFEDRLVLDESTGSLKIRNVIRQNHGYYRLDITGVRQNAKTMLYIVTVQ